MGNAMSVEGTPGIFTSPNRVDQAPKTEPEETHSNRLVSRKRSTTAVEDHDYKTIDRLEFAKRSRNEDPADNEALFRTQTATLATVFPDREMRKRLRVIAKMELPDPEEAASMVVMLEQLPKIQTIPAIREGVGEEVQSGL